MDEIRCPACESRRVASIRHDSDWCGGHDINLVNAERYYDPDDESNAGGDIYYYRCLNCWFIWEVYSDTNARMLAHLRARLTKADADIEELALKVLSLENDVANEHIKAVAFDQQNQKMPCGHERWNLIEDDELGAAFCGACSAIEHIKLVLEAIEVLGPFSEFIAAWDEVHSRPRYHDTHGIYSLGTRDGLVEITAGDFRAAAKLLEKMRGEEM